MNKVKIPKEFTIFGQTIKVEMVKDLTNSDGASLYGEAVYGKNLIRINTSFPREKQEWTFLHELLHHILNALSEDNATQDEKFVDTFSGLLHQALTTAKYME